MAVQETVRTEEARERALIERHVEADAHGGGRDEAQLRDYGTPVWALVAYLDVAKGDLAQVAHDYDVPLEAVEAALAYYRQNKALIDARIALNDA